MNRLRLKLILEAPVGDFLPDDFKKKAKETSQRLYNDAQNPAPSSAEVMSLMMNLPRLEANKKNQLEDLAIKTFFKLRPWIKTLVDNGKIKLDAKIGQSSGGRMRNQNVSQSTIQKALEKDPDFEEKIKKRNFTNARTQGKAWLDGFGSIKKMESELNSIDPSLYNNYSKFVSGASRFYWENSEMLERMASSGAGRVAYCDVYPSNQEPGVWVIEARAPHLPLLMHELIKGAEYYESLFSLPKDKELGDTIMNVADTHKHEIQNMNYGRFLWSKVRFFLEEYVSGYDPSMESDLTMMIENLPAKEYNRFMDGIVNDDNKIIGEFIKFCEDAVKEL
jgi:hypothetical protein